MFVWITKPKRGAFTVFSTPLRWVSMSGLTLRTLCHWPVRRGNSTQVKLQADDLLLGGTFKLCVAIIAIQVFKAPLSLLLSTPHQPIITTTTMACSTNCSCPKPCTNCACEKACTCAPCSCETCKCAKACECEKSTTCKCESCKCEGSCKC